MKLIKQKSKPKGKNIPLDFKGLPFEEVLSDLLKVKPEPKPKKKAKSENDMTKKR